MGNLKQQAANFANKHESKFRFAWFAKLAASQPFKLPTYEITQLPNSSSRSYVLPCINQPRGNLLRERDHIKRLMLKQPPQDHQLRAQHVAFRNRGNNLLGGSFDPVQRVCQAHLGHGNCQRGLRLETVTVGWMLIEAVVALGAAVAARSVLLAAFGLDSIVELLSGIVLYRRLQVESSGA